MDTPSASVAAAKVHFTVVSLSTSGLVHAYVPVHALFAHTLMPELAYVAVAKYFVLAAYGPPKRFPSNVTTPPAVVGALAFVTPVTWGPR